MLLHWVLVKAKNGRMYYVSSSHLLFERQTKADILAYLDDIGAHLLGAKRPGICESLTHQTFTFMKEMIYMCLDSHEPTLNTLVYVYLHELAHYQNSWSFGHGKTFLHYFKELKQRAVAQGYYLPIDYRQTPVPYCQMVINSDL